MICKKCKNEKGDEFYPGDKTCKECRKNMVRVNREKNSDYYREYDRNRFKNDKKVKERHKRYQSSDRGKESIKKARLKYINKNPVKRAAHVILGNAIRDGKVIKIYQCEVCGTKKGIIHGHHDDYSKPLNVRWLCAEHHKQWHDEFGEGLNG